MIPMDDNVISHLSFFFSLDRGLALRAPQTLGFLRLLFFLILTLSQTIGIRKVVHSDSQEDIQQDICMLSRKWEPFWQDSQK